MAGRIVRPATAFTHDGFRHMGRKKPREHNRPHLVFIKSLPSLVIADGVVDPAHIRSADFRYRKPATGGSEKPSDKWTVPLARAAHDAQHDYGDEIKWWKRIGIDPVFVAMLLFVHSGDEEASVDIIQHYRRPLR